MRGCATFACDLCERRERWSDLLCDSCELASEGLAEWRGLGLCARCLPTEATAAEVHERAGHVTSLCVVSDGIVDHAAEATEEHEKSVPETRPTWWKSRINRAQQLRRRCVSARAERRVGKKLASEALAVKDLWGTWNFIGEGVCVEAVQSVCEKFDEGGRVGLLGGAPKTSGCFQEGHASREAADAPLTLQSTEHGDERRLRIS